MINKDLIINNANIGRGGFRNFAGERGMYNAEGDRSFTILFDEATGHYVESLGWPVKWRGPRQEGDEPMGLFTVAIWLNNPRFPTKITLKSGNHETELDESNMSILDVSDIETAKVVVRPYNWTKGDRTGTKPVLRDLEVTLKEVAYDEI